MLGELPKRVALLVHELEQTRMKDLASEVAFITDSASGIGLAIAGTSSSRA
jgi:hypothetical protein